MKIIYSFFILLILCTGSAFSQSKTGDPEFDTVLKDVNARAKSDIAFFKQELIKVFGINNGKIDTLLNKVKMQPADVFMTCQVSKQTGKSVDDVAKVYEINKDKGWGEIAKQMGIKPGSAEFHALKDSAKGKQKKMKDKGKGNGNSQGKGKGKKK